MLDQLTKEPLKN
uniref:Uncharacterized protein n=1 Tax=Rhizophora mucronata TaxID=61149 RepID=A0A2P2QZ68_RHIMU